MTIPKPSFLTLAKRSPWVLIGVLFLSVGSLLFLIGGANLIQERRFRTEGQVIQGVVLDKQYVNYGRRNTPYDVRYRFTAPDGRAIEGTCEVKLETLQALDKGGPVKVEYLSGVLGSSRIAGEDPGTTAPALLTVIGGLVLPVGLVLTVKGLRRVARQSGHVGRHGRVTTGTVTTVRESALSVDRQQQWVIAYDYVDHFGRTHSGRSHDLPPEEATTWQIGDKARILFDTGHPERSSWVGRE